jgi:integrase
MSEGTKSSLVSVATNLYRHPENKIYWGRKKVAGKTLWHSLDTTDRKLAEHNLTKWIGELTACDTSSGNVTLDSMIERFLAARAGHKGGTVRTEKSIAKVLRRDFKPGKGILLSRVKTSDLQAYLAEQANRHEWKNQTYNRHRLFFLQMFNLAVADRILSEAGNPFKPRLIKARKHDKVFRRIPTAEQFEAILNDVRSMAQKQVVPGAKKHGGVRGSVPWAIESANFLEFLGAAGVGQAEASSLCWEDVDFKGGRIHFLRRKTTAKFSIPIYAWLRPLLERLHAASTGTGRVFTVRDCGKALEGACRRLGLPHFTQRNLRAMLIRRLHDAGINHKRIAEWQGHQDGGKLILQIYTEVFADSDAASEQADLARAAGIIAPFTPVGVAA